MRAHDGCARAANIKLSVVGWVGGIVQMPAAYDFSGIRARVYVCGGGGVCVIIHVALFSRRKVHCGNSLK